MTEIITYLILSLLLIFFLSYGISRLFLSKYFNKDYIFLSSWFLFIFIIIVFTLLSLAGLSVFLSSLIIVPILAGISLYFLFRDKNKQIFDIEKIIVFSFVIISIVFNLSPLIKRDKILTTVSLGNNDVIEYTLSADYLKNKSILQSFKEDVVLSIDNLLHDGFRWGPSINEAFFLNILNLEAYKYTYLFEVILYSLMIPLVYVLFKILYKPSLFGGLLILTLTTFNSNLLYMLYHNFFGLVIYWGISLFLLIFLFTKYGKNKKELYRIDLLEVLIGITIAVLYFSYHEGALFVLFPLGLYFIYLFTKKNNSWKYFKSIFRVGLISFFLGSISIINAIIFDFGQAFKGNPNQPIGWQLFRDKYPFANPFEMMGFYSIHNFGPLPNFIAILLSFFVIYVLFIGFNKSKYKSFLAGFLIIDIFFLLFFTFIRKNFFDYNRVVTYTLPIFLILFSIGFAYIFEKKKYLKYIIVFLLLLSFFSGIMLNKRFITERLSVDLSIISLKEIKEINLKEPVYAGGAVDESIPLWDQIWIGYFVYPNVKNITIPKDFLKDKNKNKVPNNSIVLIRKPYPFIIENKFILKNVIWENEYFKLGRFCNSNDCLIKSNVDLSNIQVGKSDYEDSLFLSGWSMKERNYRWAASLQANLRLVTKQDFYPKKLIIEALSLNTPQKISIYINEQLIGEQNLSKEWETYEFPLLYSLYPGVQNILFKFSHLYKPVNLGLNLDNRDLSVNFKKIALE